MRRLLQLLQVQLFRQHFSHYLTCSFGNWDFSLSHCWFPHVSAGLHLKQKKASSGVLAMTKEQQQQPMYWRDYVERKQRKYMKKLHPLMLAPNGYVTTEGTKPHGTKSRGYGKGTGVQGVQVLWDRDYAIAKIQHDLEAVSFSVHFKEWFAGLVSLYLGSSCKDEQDDLNWLKQWVLQEQKKLTKPDSPRQKKAVELLQSLDALITEKEGDGNEM